MLRKGDQAIVVVGEEQARSKTMDAALLNAFDNDGLSAQQVLLPSNASPRLDTTKLPLVQLRTASSSILLSVAAVSILSKYSMQQTEMPPSCS